MTASFFLRGSRLLAAALLLTACNDGAVVVDFVQPFPVQVANLVVFPARLQAEYVALDGRSSLSIGPRAVWQQQPRSWTMARQAFNSLPRRLPADSLYRDEDGLRHHLQLVGPDSVRDSWVACDTVFTLMGAHGGRLRRLQGRYYLNTPDPSTGIWQVQRLAIDGAKLTWQTFGTDTLRLRALDPTTVHYHRDKHVLYCELTPAPGSPTRRVGHYAGLWETAGEFARRPRWGGPATGKLLE